MAKQSARWPKSNADSGLVSKATRLAVKFPDPHRILIHAHKVFSVIANSYELIDRVFVGRKCADEMAIRTPKNLDVSPHIMHGIPIGARRHHKKLLP